jgi:hypothetical protein
MAGKFLTSILDAYANIESARGKFMNAARKEREQMTALYEQMAANGVSQKSAKTNVKITRAMLKIEGWIADLEDEDRKMAARLAKAQEDKRQLSFFPDEPKPPRAKAKAKAKATPKVVEPQSNGEAETNLAA